MKDFLLCAPAERRVDEVGDTGWLRMRKMFVHIGTHKTGTTSIQSFLSEYTDELQNSGLGVPVSGRYMYGHHYLAWELRNDKRMGGLCGYVDRLTSEIRESRLNRFVISSEDFEYLVQYPLSLRGFVRSLRRINVEPTFIVMFRESKSYLKSLVHELAKHGLDHDIQWYEEQLQKYGAILVNTDWWFDFDRARFAKRWVEVTEAELICIDYNDLIKGEGVLPNFLRIVGAHVDLIEASRLWHRMNVCAS